MIPDIRQYVGRTFVTEESATDMVSDIRPNTQIHEGHPGDARIRDGGFADIQRTSTDVRLPGGVGCLFCSP